MNCGRKQCFHPDCWGNDGCDMDSMKALATNPELLKKLAGCKAIWDRMTGEEQKEMIRLQAESWCRQTMD